MAFELELGPPPNTTMDSSSVRYLLNQIGNDRVTHIQILATAGAALLGFQALLGYRRRRSSSKVFLFLLWVAYTVSSNVVSYTVGLVQSVDERDRYSVQQWWAVGLLLLLGSADTMSAFRRGDAEQSKGMMVQHAVQTTLVLWVLVSRADNAILLNSSSRGVNWEWTITLSVCWLYSIVKMGQRIKALRMASSSHGLVRGAKVVADYMHDTVDAWDSDNGLSRGGHGGKGAARDLDSVDMDPYKYLVHGEEGRSTRPSEQTDYRTRAPVDEIVTIDKIWRCDGELLRSSGDGVGDKRRARARALKDTCLSFALFKLLKRRFCGLEVAEAGHQKARDFVLDGLLAGDDYERAFRVVELELSFAHDFFYTNYPALFPTSAVLHIARFVSLLALLKLFHDFTYIVVFTAGLKDISAVFIFSSFNDFLFISMLLGIEVMQQLSTGYSDWAVVHFVCDYVRRVEKNKKRHSVGFRQAVIKRLAARRARTSRHWQNKLGQYSLLDSFGYHPSFCNWASMVTGRLLEPTREGRNKSKAVELRGEVKVAVLQSLKESGGRLTVGRSLDSRLRWACALLPSTQQSQSDTHWKTRAHTHTVLVWHIATTMCHHLDTAAAAGSDQNDDRLVATSLSGYCAYLLAFVPEMLPDHSYTAALVLDAAVQEARNHLGDVKAMPDKCKKLRDLVENSGGDGGDRKGILMDESRLGSQLMAAGYDSRRRWKLLAEVWAELVLFLAPSDNADAHAESLARGGEFITHIWALLTHAGILDRDPAAAAPPGATAV